MSNPNFYPGQSPAEYLAKLNLLMGAGDAASQAIENADRAETSANAAAGSADAAGEAATQAGQKADQAGAAAAAAGGSATAAGQAAALAGAKADQAAAAANAAAASATAAGEAAALAGQKADQAGAAATAAGDSATVAGQAAALAGTKSDQAVAAANAAEAARDGLVPQTLLSITITGEWSQPPVIIQTPATTLQIGDTLLTNLRTVAHIGYAEVPGANTLTSVSFNDIELIAGSGGPVSGTIRGRSLDLSSASALAHVGLPSLKILFGEISLPAAVLSVDLSSLISIFGRSGMSFPSGLISIDMSSLRYAEGLNVNAALTTLVLPMLENGSITLPFGAALTTLSLPSIKRLSMSFSGSQPALSNVTLGAALVSCGSNIVFSASPLTQTSVDNILIRLAALDGTAGTTLYGTGKTVTLSGPAAAPSAAGLAAKSVLVGRGVTVTTN